MENLAKIDDFIENIGKVLFDFFDEDWSKIVMGAFVNREVNLLNVKVYVQKKSNQKYIDINTLLVDHPLYIVKLSQLTDLCNQLNDSFKKLNSEWNTMTFKMTADGKFDVDYNYDHFDSSDLMSYKKWEEINLD